MTASVQNVSPFSRFSRALGFSNKLNSTSSRSKSHYSAAKTKAQDEDWYIPYNGPVEPPKPVVRREKERDSWGDPIDGDEDDDNVLADPELHVRYGRQNSSSSDWRGGAPGGKHRTRTQSGGSAFSGRTVSSGMVDPGRTSIGLPRRSTVSGTSPRSTVPPNISVTGVEGVGDSPVPVLRTATSTPTRKSLANLFAFNSSNKKTHPQPALKHSASDSNWNSGTRTETTKFAQGPTHSKGLSPDADNQATGSARLPPDPFFATTRATATTDEAYYNSYYSTLQNSTNHLPNETSDVVADVPVQRQASRTPGLYSPANVPVAPHPYAYTFPASVIPPDPPQSAPPMQKTHFQSFPALHESSSATNSPSSYQRHLGLPENTLKNSSSTPNLRGPRSVTSPPKRNFKDRLLSAETWCDALLFPRPRLKVKRETGSGTSTPSHSVPRIISPPGSPIVNYFQDHHAAENAIASRPLAHSRSLVDLAASRAGPSTIEEPPVPLPIQQPGLQRENKSENLPRPVRPPRPRSFALDDLVLPSPVPSLARVLEEGQILEHQRKKWQTQAINSFQNERARSLSHARSKKAKRGGEKINNLEFLAARGLLGNQDPVPVHLSAPRLPFTTRPRTNSETDTRGTWTLSHGRNNSLSKTLSKSSKSHSRNHSRSDSIGKSALRMAKSTAKSTAALCGLDGNGIIITPVEEKQRELADMRHPDGLDGAIRAPGTRIIKLLDPAQAVAPLSPLSPLDSSRVSPTPPSAFLGIAISTPPLTDETGDRESIHIPPHPYAQGGFTVTVSQPTAAPAKEAHQDVSPRTAIYSSPSTHPYAVVGSSPSVDSYLGVKEVRSDSSVPPTEKMWVQWGNGVVKEVLPSDLRYSPYGSVQNLDADKTNDFHLRVMRNSSPIYDTAGIGEALAWASHRQSRDSGLGLSEEQGSSSNFARNSRSTSGNEEGDVTVLAIGDKPNLQQHGSARRIPVQYDASLPAHIHHAKKPSLSSSLHPQAPMSVFSPDTPALPVFTPPPAQRNDSSETGPGQSSSSSSPPLSPPILGNPDDLEHYKDLFYRPRGLSVDGGTPLLNLRSPAHGKQPNNIPWDVRSGTSGTGLSSIVRQLSEELEDMNDPLRRSMSLESRSSLSVLRQSVATARTPPIDASLRFVFSNIAETSSYDGDGDAALTAEPESIIPERYAVVAIPEDIETSTRASSPTSPIDADDLDAYRLRDVRTIATPNPEASDPRFSYVGEMSFSNQQDVREADENDDTLGVSPVFVRPTPRSSRQPPSADPTRSSYMTSASEEGSRMSGLSDFPAPPQQSFANHQDMHKADENDDTLGESPVFVRPTAHSSLQPPSADPTRSSYMTSASEGSHISGLSDFPAPPPQSFANHQDMHEAGENDDTLGESPVFVRPTAHSSLQPPSADPTRSSYMTSASEEGSRMSGLSDFPVPPPQHLTPAHMSLLSSYFDETMTATEFADVQNQGVHTKPGTRSRSGSLSAVASLRPHTPTDGRTLAEDKSTEGVKP